VTDDNAARNMLALCAAILVGAVLFFASSVVAPIAFALFVIAIVWPFQKTLQARMPKPAALAIVVLTTLIVVAVVGSAIAWSFGIESQWVANNASNFQTFYFRLMNWLEGHDIVIVRSIAGRFDVMWMVRGFRELAVKFNGLVGFFFIAATLIVIGLLEVDDFKHRVACLDDPAKARLILQVCGETTVKFRKYLVVRTLVSALTGILTWVVALLAHLPFAGAWGVTAFALNYVPFIGSFVATVLPALFAMFQFESWEKPAIIFLALMAIQVVTGNYLEPLLSGALLDISPFTVVVSVFLWSFLWGIPGAVIGVPVTLAILTACQHQSSTQWIALLLSGRALKPQAK
jgi:AI-2 transport protein TqsA